MEKYNEEKVQSYDIITSVDLFPTSSGSQVIATNLALELGQKGKKLGKGMLRRIFIPSVFQPGILNSGVGRPKLDLKQICRQMFSTHHLRPVCVGSYIWGVSEWPFSP